MEAAEHGLADRRFAGIDIGASRTKVVLLDDRKQMLGNAVRKTGTDFGETADRCLDDALGAAGCDRRSIKAAVATGYGRKNVAFITETAKTEISCHARGCYQLFPEAMTIIDIGGQDNKIIKLDAAGRRISFKMNRKCAAGTGAFLEEMALRLDLPLERLDGLAREAAGIVELGSFCTVFSATEVLGHIRQGRAVPDIVKGLFLSVIKRVLEMDSLVGSVVMTGGVVAHNPFLVDMAREMIDNPVRTPEHPQLTGALGAALFALDAASHTEPDT